jgi:hypothetical protein
MFEYKNLFIMFTDDYFKEDILTSGLSKERFII